MNTVKKALAVLLCAAMTASVIIFSPSAEAALYKTGDADGNCSVNAKDAYLMKKSVADTAELFDGADIDRDGTVTARDILYLKAEFAGAIKLSESFPEGYGWKGFTVAGRDISEYRIIVSDPDNPNMCFAAQELQKYIKEGNGAELSVEHTPGASVPDDGGAIVFLTGEPSLYGTDGFTLSVTNGNLIIEAAAKRGSMYAVYALLEDYFGYRFYGYDDYELLRDSASDIPEGTEDTQIPTVNYRCNCIDPFSDSYVYSSDIKRKLSGCTSHPSMQNEKYGYGICRLFANAHSFDVFIPEVEYYKAIEDPDYLETLTEEEIEAASRGITRCLSNEVSFELCLKNMRNLLDSRIAAGGVIGNDITEISCSYSAYEKICTCRACNKVMNAEKSASGILVRFVNRIDNALRAEYPGITVITNGYGTWRKPPQVSVLNPEVILLYCWGGCTAHNIGSGDCSGRVINGDLGSNTVEENYFYQWQEHCSRMYIWYYPTNIYYLLCPQPNFFKIYNDFRFFTSHGVEGFYVVGTTGSSFEDLDAYLICDLMWDTQMSREEFDRRTKEYLRFYYGYGWIYIYEYMQMLCEAGSLKGCVLNDYEQPFDIYSKEYFKDNYERMTELFEMALSEAATPEEQSHVERLSVHMKFLGLSATYEESYENGDEASRAEYAETWRWVYDYINSNGIRTTHDSTGLSAPFTLDKSPMMTVYGIDGDRY